MINDEQLLQAYARERSESAFGELVTRHLDCIYSAALRVVNGDTPLAQDVTQTVFIDLARQAGSLPRDVVLSGWLHRHTCYTAAKAVRTEQRRQTRENTAMEMRALDDNTRSEWEQVAPYLDESLNELNPADRDALVLRFLRQQDLRAVGEALGISEDAARKRVDRALEKLHARLKQRGATLSVTALGTALATEVVTAAPAGLAAKISSAAVLAASTIPTTTTIAATKVTAMTTLHKILITATAAVLAGAGIYEARQVANARAEVQTLQQQQTPFTEQIRQLQSERDERARELAALRVESERLSKNAAELLKLRGEVGVLRRQVTESTFLKPASTNTNAVQNFDDKSSQYLTQDNKKLIMSVRVGWRISDAMAFSLKFPGGSALAAQRQLEDMVGSVKAAVIGRHNLSDCIISNPSELRLDQIEKEIKSAVEKDLTENNYGVSIAALTCSASAL